MNKLVIVVALGLLLNGCGNSNSTAPTIQSCNFPLLSFCVNYTQAQASSGQVACETVGVGFLGLGTWSTTTACASSPLVGTCVDSNGNAYLTYANALYSNTNATALASCTTNVKGTYTASTSVQSCNLASTGSCIDYTPAGYVVGQASCNALSGTWSTSVACTSTGRIGSCAAGQGATYRYYSPYNSTTAQAACTSISGGAYTAN